MVRLISCEQLRKKIDAFWESAFPIRIREHITMVEVGPSEVYDRIHLWRAIYLDPTRVTERARALLPDKGTQIILYGEDERSIAPHMAARDLTKLGYYELYLLEGGKKEWIARGLWTNTSLTPAAGFREPTKQISADISPSLYPPSVKAA